MKYIASVTNWLRLEGVAVLVLSLFFYDHYGSSWLLFIALLFLPDIAMLGYLANEQIGALSYNLFHTYLGPALLLGLGVLLGVNLLISLSLIWFAHIGLDRLLGYGLKLPTGFKHTHLNHA